MAQMLAARETVGNYQPSKGDWRSASVQELIAQERQRSLLWRPQRFFGWEHGQPLAKIERSEGR